MVTITRIAVPLKVGTAIAVEMICVCEFTGNVGSDVLLIAVRNDCALLFCRNLGGLCGGVGVTPRRRLALFS